MADNPTILTTVGVALAAGSLVQVIASRLQFPAIALLLLVGVALGPSGIGVVVPSALGHGLEPLIGLAVAIILFEGGLTLDLEGFRSAPVVIRRLVTSGAICTWLGAALIAHLCMGMAAPMALLTGSLIIVTGPTVVTPLLRRLRVVKRLHDILHWEAVLIDPVGVFIALLCFEWVVLAGGSAEARLLGPVAAFGIRILSGTSLGVLVGFGLAQLLRRRWIPSDHVNIFVLSSALFVYGLADLGLPHTGILAVTIAGLVLGWLRPPQLRLLRIFKLEMTELAVAFLFILLAANLDPGRFVELGWGGVFAVVAVMFLLRPLVVGIATLGVEIGWRERAFMAWLAPRGIVAASMASLFAYELASDRAGGAERVDLFTFAVIASTVLVQGTTAGLVARLLGVRLTERTGWAIIGAGALGRSIAEVLAAHHVAVVLIDRNARSVEAARARGLRAFGADALDPTLPGDPRLAEVGQLLCATENPPLNRMLAEHWREVLGEHAVTTWAELSLGDQADLAHADPHAATRLAVPADIDRALGSGQLRIRTLDATDPLPIQARGLLYLQSGKARRASGPKKSAEERVVLEWRPVSPMDLFQRILSLEDLGLGDIETIYARLVAAASEVQPGLDRGQTLAALAPQVDLDRVILGNGVAIPHVTSPSIERPCCIVGLLEPSSAEASLGAAVSVICLLISPAGEPTAHLEALARIASWASDADAVAGLLQAGSHEERLAVLNAQSAADAENAHGLPLSA